jgi:ornithine cyclodeaminase/alanine dehydrogenase-like protein (mu-crystallin family)
LEGGERRLDALALVFGDQAGKHLAEARVLGARVDVLPPVSLDECGLDRPRLVLADRAAALRRKVTCVGCGLGLQDAVHRADQLAALRRVRPVAVVRIFDPVSNAAKRLAADPASQGLDVVLARDLDEALDGADIVITATWAEEPFILRRHLRRGLHITTVGPDQPGKCEVAAEALLAASIVVDDRTLAATMGAVGNAGLTADAIHAELGEIVAGVKSGRLMTPT